MRLVIYGDFNCPFSALASERAARAHAAGIASVEWRAVQHLPDLPPDGEPVDGELADDLAEELDRIGGLLLDGEPFPAGVPAIRPNTAAATAAFATAADGQEALRRQLFRTYWFDGRDISDPDVLAGLGARPPAEPPEGIARWQQAWEDLDRPITPMMQRSDGTVARGLEALDELAELLTADAVEPRP